MKINACPKCGSKRIYMGTMGAGVTFGITSWKHVCRNCGYQGMPLVFDSEKEYKKFLEGLEKDKDFDKRIESEKEMVEFLNGLKEEESQREEKIKEEEQPHADKAWWNEIVLAMVISAVLIILLAPGLFSLMDVNFVILYSVLSFITSTLGFLLWIVVMEYFYKMVKKALKKEN